MAGAEGIEPPLNALEALVLPLDHAPVGPTLLLCFFFVKLVFAAEFAKTHAFELHAVSFLQVAVSVIVIVLALRALEANEVILAHGILL